VIAGFLTLLRGGKNPIPLSGKVHRCQGGFSAPQRRDGRSPVHGSRRCLHQRHARADPLASQEDGCSPVSTASHQRRRINHRGHRRLALLGGARRLLLNRASRFRATQPCRKDTEIRAINSLIQYRRHPAVPDATVCSACSISGFVPSTAGRSLAPRSRPMPS